MDIFFELYQDLPRGGPGSTECTKKAYSLLPELPKQPKTLDVGCGVGPQTMALAGCTAGQITAIDTHQPFLDKLERKIKAANLSDRINVLNCSMFKMTFEPESFDIIWSEGAIYLMGFENGLKAWRSFLKPGGYLVVSELSWLKADANPPQELYDFWMEEDPGIKSINENLTIISKCDYTEIAHFTLPEAVWWDEFYTPLEQRIRALQKKYSKHPKASQVLNREANEIALFRRYSKWYGYVFYLMQKKDSD